MYYMKIECVKINNSKILELPEWEHIISNWIEGQDGKNYLWELGQEVPHGGFEINLRFPSSKNILI